MGRRTTCRAGRRRLRPWRRTPRRGARSARGRARAHRASLLAPCSAPCGSGLLGSARAYSRAASRRESGLQELTGGGLADLDLTMSDGDAVADSGVRVGRDRADVTADDPVHRGEAELSALVDARRDQDRLVDVVRELRVPAVAGVVRGERHSAGRWQIGAY